MFLRRVVSNKDASQSLGGLLKTDCWALPPEVQVQQVGMGPSNLHFFGNSYIKIPREPSVPTPFFYPIAERMVLTILQPWGTSFSCPFLPIGQVQSPDLATSDLLALASVTPRAHLYLWQEILPEQPLCS